jgi:hypothetical protein
LGRFGGRFSGKNLDCGGVGRIALYGRFFKGVLKNRSFCCGVFVVKMWWDVWLAW